LIIIGVGTGDDANLVPDLFGWNGGFLYFPYGKHLRLARAWILFLERKWIFAVKIFQELTERSQILAAMRAALGIIRHGGPATLAFHHESLFESSKKNYRFAAGTKQE
jgi:hypothetical protein